MKHHGYVSDRAPYASPDEEAALAEWLATPGPIRPVGDQVIGWNETSDYWNEATDNEPGREAGE